MEGYEVLLNSVIFKRVKYSDNYCKFQTVLVVWMVSEEKKKEFPESVANIEPLFIGKFYDFHTFVSARL